MVEIIVLDVQSNNICMSLIHFSICVSPVSLYNCSGKPLSYSMRKTATVLMTKIQVFSLNYDHFMLLNRCFVC